MIRLRSPIYRFEDDYGDEIWALRKPWRRNPRLPGRRATYSITDEAHVIDMSEKLTMLDPDMTQFNRMLFAVSTASRPPKPHDPDDWVGSRVHPEAQKAVTAFEIKMGIREKSPERKIEWLEDELMPRSTAILTNAHRAT